MQKDVRIRAARSADVQAISTVLSSCGMSGGDMDSSARLYSLATLGEQVIGCACAEILGERVVIQAVAVLAEYRGHQVGTHLFRAVLMRARARGCAKAAVFTSEHPEFFARFGFALTSLADLPREMQLSKEFLRRFGAGARYMCGGLH
ncbi:GNAT family N-acetyltransferase [Cupriavidus sp. RAF12]|uniref:GNAT family N-acetyltransferase n=1 Tax=Cupriavidus sp. RAF12 TaxID=3233050 RepID=UPI003F8F21F3